MKIVFAASEGVPFCKTGGLADVVGALSKELASKKHTVRMALPLYRQIREARPRLKKIGPALRLQIGGDAEDLQLWESNVSGTLKAFFVQADRWFDRPGLYGPNP